MHHIIYVYHRLLWSYKLPKYGESSAKAVLSNVHCAKAGSVVAKAPRKDLRKHQVSIMEYTNPFEHRSCVFTIRTDKVCVVEWRLGRALRCHHLTSDARPTRFDIQEHCWLVDVYNIYILQYPTFKGKSISALLLGFSRFFNELQAASLNIALPHARTYFEGVFFLKALIHIDPFPQIFSNINNINNIKHPLRNHGLVRKHQGSRRPWEPRHPLI